MEQSPRSAAAKAGDRRPTALPVSVDALTSGEPRLALQWLAWLRRILALAQLLVLWVGGAAIEAPLLAWLALGLILVFDGVVGLWSHLVRPGPRAALGVALIDVALFAVASWTEGGAESPIAAMMLVQVALGAALLGPRSSAVLSGAALLAFAGGAWPQPHAHDHVAGSLVLHGPSLDSGHRLGHLVAFALAVVALTFFIGKVTAALRAAQAAQARDQRLAAVGTLAAGVAHALGTPLGTIRLLSDELEAELPPEARPHPAARGIEAQLVRARGILDALLQGAPSPAGDEQTAELGAALAAWIAEWRAAQPAELQLQVGPLGALAHRSARGPASGWRAALWSLLDNARQAGGALSLSVELSQDGVCVVISDEGAAMSAAVAARVGEPFFSAWPDRRGTGLGLHSAEGFARGYGGAVSLRPGKRGAEARLFVPFAPAVGA